jgi:hypothetical protein
MKNRKTVTAKTVALTLFLTFWLASNVSALILGPSDADLFGDETSNADIIALFPGLDELYKADVGSTEADLPFKDSYSTVFSNTPNDPADALITYTGGPVISGNPLWLIVKDGNQTPAWYAFDLSTLGFKWNGTESIELTGFWPSRGAISHVEILGTQTSVPEPSTLLLLGVGLAGFAFLRRRR